MELKTRAADTGERLLRETREAEALVAALRATADDDHASEALVQFQQTLRTAIEVLAPAAVKSEAERKQRPPPAPRFALPLGDAQTAQALAAEAKSGFDAPTRFPMRGDRAFAFAPVAQARYDEWLAKLALSSKPGAAFTLDTRQKRAAQARAEALLTSVQWVPADETFRALLRDPAFVEAGQRLLRNEAYRRPPWALETFTIGGDDPREALRHTGRGVRLDRQSATAIEPAQFLGFYCGVYATSGDLAKLVLRHADVVHQQRVGCCTFDAGQYDKCQLVVCAHDDLGDVTALINDPRIDVTRPWSAPGNSVRPAGPNVVAVRLFLCGWPFLALFASHCVRPGDELLLDYGPGYWDPLLAGQPAVDRELARRASVARLDANLAGSSARFPVRL